MYIPNYNKYKTSEFWLGFLKVAIPALVVFGILYMVLMMVGQA